MVNTTTKPNRMWRSVLVLSLALNIAVIGGVVGMAVSGRGHNGPPQRMMFDFGPLGSVLEPHDRRAIGQAMRRNGARPQNRKEMADSIAVLATTLRTMPFDVNAVEDIIGTLRSRSEQIQVNAQNAFLARLATMTPEARSALADRLESKRRR